MSSATTRLPDAEPGESPGRVEIVLAADENFLPFCAATMASVLCHSPPQDELRFHILTDAPFKQKHTERFEELKEIRDCSIEVHVVDGEDFRDVRTTPGISVATYFRLLLPSVLPETIEKVLYLDSDLAVLDRVRKLYDIDMGDRFLLGIEDSISRSYNRKFGEDDDAVHMNGGVLLMNLAALRRASYYDLIKRYVQRNRFTITLGDQQILNAVFGHRSAYVDVRWNVHGSMFVPRWRRLSAGEKNHYSQEELERAALDPAIIHYTYKRKPWMSDMHPRYSTYLEYLRMTRYWEDFADSVPPMRNEGRVRVRADDAIAKGHDAVRRARSVVRKWWKTNLDDIIAQRVERRTRSARVYSQYAADAAYDQWMSMIFDRQSDREIDLTELTNKPEPFKYFIGNAAQGDLDGGELQNYKLLFRTNRISNPNAAADWKECDGLFLCRWRRAESQQLAVLQHAVRYAKPIVFVETSFFGGCVTWANRDAPVEFRRPFGFIVDDLGYYYDRTRQSRLRMKLLDQRYEAPDAQLERARSLVARVRKDRLTKYNSMPDKLPSSVADSPGNKRVLVVDQTRGDASIELGRAAASTFEAMLRAAKTDYPDAQIHVKTHPDSMVGPKQGRPGYFGPDDAGGRVHLLSDAVNPQTLMSAFDVVYVVSSQMGFEALVAGKKVVCFGEPFYSGVGLTDDRFGGSPMVERSLEELFHLACVEHSHYVDPTTGDPCEIERAFDIATEMRERYLDHDNAG